MTLLEVVTQFCQLKALPVPASVMGSTDAQVTQIRRLLEKSGRDLRGRGIWEKLTFEALWSTTASEDQGAITALATNGYRAFLPWTLWDRTEMLPLLGPTSAKEWQFLKAIVITGPRFSFRLRGGHFLVTPAPPAGHTWVFEYCTNNFILQSNGTTYLETFANDTDEILFPDEIVMADLEWRWLKEKGLDYAEDFKGAEGLINVAVNQDGGKPALYMDEYGQRGPTPGIFVPAGSWAIP